MHSLCLYLKQKKKIEIEIFKEKEEFMEEKVLLKDMVGTLKNCEFKNAVIPMGIDETGNFVYENSQDDFSYSVEFFKER